MTGKGSARRDNFSKFNSAEYWKVVHNGTVSITCFCGCEIIVKPENLPVTCSRCQSKHEVKK